jgi:hypothetical protein
MAVTIATLALTLRSDQAGVLTAEQHDANLTAIKDKVNALIGYLLALMTYGEMYLSGASAALSLAVADTWYKVVGFAAGHLDQITHDATKHSLVVPAEGDYLVRANVSFTGQATHTYKLGFGVGDGTTQAVDTHHLAEHKVATADVVDVAFSGIVHATAGQHITIHALDVGGTGNLTAIEATVVLERKE